MLSFSFHPEADRPDLVEAAAGYQAIWDADGSRIVEALTDLSKLAFKGRFFHALVHAGPTTAFPLHFDAKATESVRKAAIVHELTHRLFADNKLDGPIKNDQQALSSHARINLVLFDTWVRVWGEEFARQAVATESKARPVYRRAWQLTFTMDAKRRSRQLQQLTKPRREWTVPVPHIEVRFGR